MKHGLVSNSDMTFHLRVLMTVSSFITHINVAIHVYMFWFCAMPLWMNLTKSWLLFFFATALSIQAARSLLFRVARKVATDGCSSMIAIPVSLFCHCAVPLLMNFSQSHDFFIFAQRHGSFTSLVSSCWEDKDCATPRFMNLACSCQLANEMRNATLYGR